MDLYPYSAETPTCLGLVYALQDHLIGYEIPYTIHLLLLYSIFLIAYVSLLSLKAQPSS